MLLLFMLLEVKEFQNISFDILLFTFLYWQFLEVNSIKILSIWYFIIFIYLFSGSIYYDVQIILLFTNIKLILLFIYLTTFSIYLIFILVEIINIITLFLFFTSRLLYRILLLWYLHMYNSVLFICLLCMLYYFFVLRIHYLFDFWDYSLYLDYYYVLSFSMNIVYILKFYVFIIFLFFEQIYFKISFYLYIYLLTFYIHVLLVIFSHILYWSTIFIILKFIIFHFLFISVLLVDNNILMNIFFLISNLNLLYYIFIILFIKNYIFCLIMLYHFIYSVFLAVFIIINTAYSSTSPYNISSTNNAVLYQPITLNFYSDYIFSLFVILCIICLGGLPFSYTFILKLLLIVSSLNQLGSFLLLLLFFGFLSIYFVYYKLICKIYIIQYSKFNLYTLTNYTWNAASIFYGIIIVTYLNFDPLLIFDFVQF